MHFYVFLLCISIVFLLFSAYYPLLFQHFFFYYALLLYSSTAWVLCYCVPAIAFQHYFILCVFPLRVLILFLATSIFSMRISIVLQHFVVRACLLCSTFLLYSKTPRQKCGQEGPLNNFFLLCGGMFGHSSCLNRTKECHRQASDPPNTESQKIKLKSHPVWLRFGGSKRCHLPVICLGKTRRNMGIINILIPIFRLAFYRETKWPKWTQMANFSMVWRLPGRHRKRCDDVLGAKAGLQRGRSAKRKHR